MILLYSMHCSRREPAVHSSFYDVYVCPIVYCYLLGLRDRSLNPPDPPHFGIHDYDLLCNPAYT